MDIASLGLGGLLGTFLGLFLGHRLAIHRDKISKINSAKYAFREIVFGALSRAQTSSNLIHQVLQVECIRIYEEGLKLTAYLSESEKSRLNDALNELLMWNDLVNNRAVEHRLYGGDPAEYERLKESKPETLLLNLVENLKI
ncbi:hypothetical protein [Marinobacterium jannaschii]|uniref:hypothetical protein n=1 Tax=Marinobacterium jannaschii TaxID=64970 RepID=UPI00047F9192|nr:hypothetical protein [Marinobacterium jannaschii]